MKISVKVNQDTQAALIRGELVERHAIVELEMTELSEAVRTKLVGSYHKGGADFELYRTFDQPTAEKVKAYLEEAVKEEKERADLANEVARREREEEEAAFRRFITACEDYVSAPTSKYIKEHYGIAVEYYRVSGLPPCGYNRRHWKGNPKYIAARELKEKQEAENEAAYKAALPSINAKIAEEAYIKAQEMAGRRKETGKYEVEYDSYNPRRYSLPWGAVVTLLTNGSLSYDFKAAKFLGDDDGGTLSINCVPGTVIAYGQKDFRGNGTEKNLRIILDDFTEEEVSVGTAKAFLGGEYEPKKTQTVPQPTEGDVIDL